MLKVKFKNPQMAQRAVKDGMVVVSQKIAAKHIEKEIFVRLTPCYNCFSYEHKTRACDKEKQTICSFCAQSGHYVQNCTSETPKCINCNGKHRTLASACAVRKQLIKTRGKELSERSRSRSRTQIDRTYAGITTEQPQPQRYQQQYQQSSIPDTKDTKQLISKILTSIVYAHYTETLTPGSFHNTIKEMFEINGLPQVNFPQNIVTTNISEILKDSVTKVQHTQKQQQQQQGEDIELGETLATASNASNFDMEIETSKRARERESTSPEEISEIKKKREEDRMGQPKEQREPERLSLVPISKPVAPPTHAPTKGDAGGGAVGIAVAGTRGEGAKEKTTTTKSNRESSLSRPKQPTVNARDVGITVYIRRSANIKVDLKDQECKEKLWQIITKGEIRIQWRHPKITYEVLFGGLLSRSINLEDIKIEKCNDKEFEKIKTKCISTILK